MEAIISQVFDSVSSKFFVELVKKNIIKSDDVSTAKAIWKSCFIGISVNVEFENGDKETFTEDKKKSKPVVNEESDKCVYVPNRGKSKGTVCGKRTVNGKKMCSTHKKYESELVERDPSVSEGEAPIEKKTCIHLITKGKEAGRPCGANVKNGEFCARHTKSETKEKNIEEPKIEKEKPNILSIDKKTGRWTHKESGFVMKSKDERVVNGKILDGNIIDITEEDIEEIKKLKFKYELPIRLVMKKSDVEEIVKEMLDDDAGEELEDNVEEDDNDVEEDDNDVEEELLEDDE
jgi:hypothetical protein